jgi:hypothetical protein
MSKLKGSGPSSPAVRLRRAARLGVAVAAVVAAVGSATAASAQPRAVGPDTLPTKIAVSQVVLTNGDTDVFYVGSNGQVDVWSYVAGWTQHQLGTGEKVKAGTGIAAVQQSNGNISVYYVGSSNGQIYNWLYTTSTGWINGIIAEGEKAAAGADVTQVQNPNGTQNVYYVGANDQVFNWYFNGAHWSNGQLGAGEAAKPTSGITSVYQPANGDEQVFYVGANGQIYNWLFSTTEGWLNGPIGSGEKAAAGAQLTDVYQSSDGDQNVPTTRSGTGASPRSGTTTRSVTVTRLSRAAGSAPCCSMRRTARSRCSTPARTARCKAPCSTASPGARESSAPVRRRRPAAR